MGKWRTSKNGGVDEREVRKVVEGSRFSKGAKISVGRERKERSSREMRLSR